MSIINFITELNRNGVHLADVKLLSECWHENDFTVQNGHEMSSELVTIVIYKSTTVINGR